MDDLIDAPQSTIRQPSLIERHFGNTHPIAVLFYLAFKAGGMAYYILCGWLPMNYIVTCVVVVTLLAVVKLNVDYLLLAVSAVILSGSNAYGYHKCSKAQQNQLKGLVNRGIAQGVKSYFGF